MAILKRRASQDSEGLKRQSLLAPHGVAELENIQSSSPTDISTSPSSRLTKAQSVFGLDELTISKLSPPSAFTHILDVAPPLDPSLRLREEDLVSVPSSTPVPASAPASVPVSVPNISPVESQFRTSRPAGKMTSRPPEQEFGNIRALSRFLRATGPLELDDRRPSTSHSSSHQRTLQNRPVLARSLNSAPLMSLNSRLPVSSSDYFKALDARLDQYDQDINDREEDTPPPLPAKSIRKSRSIGEPLSIKARARSHSTATGTEPVRSTLFPSPLLAHTSPVSSHNSGPTSLSPVPTGAGNAPAPSTGNRLRGFSGLATILRRKKSGSATTTRKGNGHNRHAGIGSDDFFAPPSELGQLPPGSGDFGAPGSKASPFSFRRYATQAADTPLPPIFRSPPRKGSSTSPSRVTDAEASGDAEISTSPVLPSLPQSPLLFTPPSSSPSSSISYKQKRIPVPRYDSQTSANGANPSSPSTHSHAVRNRLAPGDYAGYDDDDSRSDDGKDGDDRVEKISIDGDLGEFHPSPGPEQQSFSASPTADSHSHTSPTAASMRSGVGMATTLDSPLPERFSLEREKKSSESELLPETPILITEPTPRPSTTSSGSKLEKVITGVYPFPMAATAGSGTMPPISPPPAMPLPLPPSPTPRPSLSLVGAMASPSTHSGLSPTRLLTPSTISSLPSTSSSIITSSLSEVLVAADAVSCHASAASLTPPPSSFVRLRARTLSPVTRPSTQPQFPPVHGSLSSASSSPSTLVLHTTVVRLEAALAATNAQVEKVTGTTKTVMEALRAAESREAILLERVERLERALGNSALHCASEGNPDPRHDMRAIIEASPPRIAGNDSVNGNSRGRSLSGSSGTATATASKAAVFPPAILAQSSPPTRPRLPRRRTLSSEVFPLGSLTSDDTGVIRRTPSSASEDGHSTGTYMRNRVTRKKSLKRSRSSSRAGGIKERRLNPPRQSTMIPPPSAASGAESFYSALGSPSPATTESQVEAEFERRGTMSLLTRAQPRKKRALPLSGPNVSNHAAPTIELTTTDSTVATKKRPIPLRTGGTDTETSTDYPTSAHSTVPTMTVPRFPAISAHDSERSSMASSLAAVDNNHIDSRATQRSSATSQTLIVPSRFSRSSSNSASDSPSRRSSPSFEQLVDLLEDLAAKTPSASGAPFEDEETETSRASSIIVPSLD